MDQLHEQLHCDLELKGYSPKTCQRYLACVEAFIQHFQRPPEQLGREELRAYLHGLLTERQISQFYLNQTYSALKFFYETTLRQDWSAFRIPRSRQAKRLPVVLSRAELEGLFSATRNLKHRAVLMTIYSAGLRLAEATQLQVADIDSQQMLIRVRQGKGQQERYTLLAQRTLQLLREYWRQEHPVAWLFPGQRRELPLSTRSVQKVMEQAVARAHLRTAATVHSLRHSFATPLLEAGVSLPHIQRLLGHRQLTTTAVYLHTTRQELTRIISPIDVGERRSSPTT